MAPDRHGSAVIEFPNDLEIVIIRELDAPIELVFDVSPKPEHARKTIAPFEEEVTECSIDLRVSPRQRRSRSSAFLVRAPISGSRFLGVLLA